jgi:hypothetical protein
MATITPQNYPDDTNTGVQAGVTLATTLLGGFAPVRYGTNSPVWIDEATDSVTAPYYTAKSLKMVLPRDAGNLQVAANTFGNNNIFSGLASGRDAAAVNTAPAVIIADGDTNAIEGASAQSITFTGTTGTLKLDDALAFTGQISGLTGSDALDLANISFGAKTTATFSGNANGGTLTVTDGIHAAHIALLGDYLKSGWTLSSDGKGGTVLVDPPLGSAYPNATNTGVPAGVKLTPSGSLTLSTPGQVVSGLLITGSVYITAPNVTLENCLIEAGGYYGVEVAAGVTGVTIQNCEIDGQGNNGTAGSTAINILQGAGVTINGCNLHDAADGVSLAYGNITVENTYIHDLLAPTNTNHYNGIQYNGGGPNNLLIQNNTIINTQGQTDAVMIDNYWGAVSNVTIANNLLAGGDYTVYVDSHFNSSPITNVKITNNDLGMADYGPLNLNSSGGGTYQVTTTGNVDDGDALVAALPVSIGSGSSPPPPPTAPVITSFSPDTSGVDSTSTVNLNGTAAASSTVTVYDGNVNLGTTPVGTSGNWSFTENNAVNGVHTFTATDTDANGTSAASSGFPVTVNVSSPPPPPPQTNLVVNGGFETGDFTGWTIGSYQPDQTNITTNAEAGQYAAALGPAGGDGSLSQNIPTTAGQQYTLTFWLANMSTATDEFSAKWNGTTIFSLVNAPAQPYTEYTFTVTGTAGSSTLEFDYRQDPTQWRLDAISAQNVSPSGYSSYENVYNTAGVQVATAEDMTNGSGQLLLYANRLTISSSSGQLSVTTGPDTFQINSHATEAISAAGLNSETFGYKSGFGDSTITGFVAGRSTGDVVQFDLSMFTGLNSQNTAAQDLAVLLSPQNGAAAQAVQSGPNVTITDLAGDVLTLAGVTTSTLTRHANSAFKFV